ncbi:hypothetical protein [Microbacterium hydrocarbonoxydans]|uniref:hypothetical protein n=1 Tax=Microbacterium hydrocarbonoxydans TaxID=273678 RepID=UPI003D97525F
MVKHTAAPLSENVATPAMALTVASFTDLPEVAASFPELVDHPLLDAEEWRALRDSVLPPDDVTPLVTTWQTRLEFLVGATMLGLIEHVEGGRTAKPQQLLVADVLNAGLPINGVMEPRRSTKTSSILAVFLGRCAVRPKRYSAFTLATTGLKAREKFREEVIDPIEARWPDAATRPVKIHRAAGSERLEWGNRSVFSVHPPLGSAFRSSAYDDVLIDEGGEAEDAMTADLLAAIPPTFDTTGGQLTVSGTAGKRRGEGNLLHRVLTDKRLGAGILRYGAPDSTTDEELSAWEPTPEHPEGCVRELVERHHPGVGNLTPLEAVHRSYLLMPREVFIREYLGIFGEEGGTTSLFEPLKWARTGSDDALPTPPERFSLAFAPHPDQLCVSILAAWRDEEGRAVPLLLEDVDGIDKAVPLLAKYARKYRLPIAYDAGSQVAQLIVEKLNRLTPRPRFEPYTFTDVKRAASLVVDEVERENVRHYRAQTVLTEAIHKTVKRKAGDRGWLLGRDPKQPNDNITPTEAWALAQLHYDNARPKRRARGKVAA